MNRLRQRLLTSSMLSTTLRNGFTLVELLIVIAILGILAAIGLSSFQSASKTARDGKRKGDINQVRAALELYRSQYNLYPSSSSFTTATQTLNTAGYLSAPLPVDPKNVSPYQYSYNSAGNTYCMCAHMENGGGNSTGSCNGSSGNFYCLTQP